MSSDSKKMKEIEGTLSKILKHNLSVLERLKKLEKSQEKEKLDKLIGIIKDHDAALDSITADEKGTA